MSGPLSTYDLSHYLVPFVSKSILCHCEFKLFIIDLISLLFQPFLRHQLLFYYDCLFLITLDEVLRVAFDTKNRGIRWGLPEHLEDLDYADDICLLCSKGSDKQYKLNDLQ